MSCLIPASLSRKFQCSCIKCLDKRVVRKMEVLKFELLFLSSSAVFSSSPGSNGNSSSWSSLGLEGDMYEENLSFPTSDRLVELRNINQMGSS